jgi:putative PIN family toxin of toxin-antitoxin system
VRVFFDTNVPISAFTARGLSSDLFRLVLAEHDLLTGAVNLVELRRVLRSRFRVPATEIAIVEQQLREHSIVPKPAEPSPFRLRDPDDRWVLASAVAGGADVLVTGDRDLLAVSARAPLPILDPRGCWELLQRER